MDALFLGSRAAAKVCEGDLAQPRMGSRDPVSSRSRPRCAVIYTTNVESIKALLRKIIKTRGHFPSLDEASKLIWLALLNITANWCRTAPDWKTEMNQFAILCADRFIKAAA